MAKKNRFSSILLGCLVCTCIIFFGISATGMDINGTAANNTYYGTDDDDVIFGYGGDDKLYGSPLSFYTKDLTGRFVAPSKSSGHDVLYGDGAVNDTSQGQGNDTLLVGYEATPYYSASYDDTVRGGPGLDVLAGIWQENNDYIVNLYTFQPEAMTGWHDDLTIDLGYQNGEYNFARTTIANAARIAQGTSKEKVYDEVLGDKLYGGPGSDVFFTGIGDKPIDKTVNRLESDVVWKIGDKGRLVSINDNYSQPYKLASGLLTLDPKSTDFMNNTGFAGPNSFGLAINLFPTAASAFIPIDFTRGEDKTTHKQNHTDIWFGVHDSGARERGEEYLNYAPISQSEDGDIIMRFKAGIVVIGAEGNYIFLQREDGQPLKNGDFGINFPVLKGYEKHTNDYFIDSGLWQQDMLSELKRQGKSSDSIELTKTETTAWLENILYPVLEPFHRALEEAQAVAYETVQPNNSLKRIAYDEHGQKIAVPVNVANR